MELPQYNIETSPAGKPEQHNKLVLGTHGLN